MHKTTSRALVLVWLLLAGSLARADTREWILTEGLNLVSHDLALEPSDPATVFASIENRIEYVASYDSSASRWRRYYPARLGHPPYLNTLENIEPGVGYAIQINDGLDLRLTLNGSLPVVAARPIESGWNLIGFLSTREVIWFQPLGQDQLKCRGMATYEDGFDGFLLPDPPYDDTEGEGDPEDFDWLYEDFKSRTNLLREVVPGRGYWVRTDDSFVLGPQLALWMESDIDAGEPSCETFPVAEENDEDLNGQGDFNYGFTVWDGFGYARDECEREIKATQDAIFFRVPKGAASPDAPVLIQAMTIANRGDRGGQAAYSGNDELRFEIELDKALQSWLEVEPLSGFVQGPLNPNRVELQADIQDLPVGLHNGNLTVRSTGAERTVAVKIEVPGISGRFQGEVRTWLGDQSESETSVIRSRRVVKVDIEGETCTLLKSHSPFLEEDVVMSFAQKADGSFSASGELTIDAKDPSNVIGVAYTRRFTLEGNRSSDDPETHGTLLPLRGTYSEVMSGLGPDLLWTGRFLLQQVVEPE